jgi:antitoxin component YwqK of YwqJK toxin-antitoxin module
MKSEEWKKILLPISLIIFLVACSESSIEQEAEEILKEKAGDQEIEIQQSVDGLQFKQATSNTQTETSVGFSQEGHLTYEGDFKDGKPEGLWTTFFPDGKPRWQGIKKNGFNHGPFKMWYENGRKKLEGTYHEGKKHQSSTAWYPDGTRWQHKFYKHGTPTGTWKTWDEMGNLVSEIFHEKITELNATKTKSN